jgi:hypothetical protein
VSRPPIRTVVAIAITSLLTTPGAAIGDDAGLPAGVVLTSSATCDRMGVGSFTMTAANEGETTVTLVAPAPVSGHRVSVDLGAWDGKRWAVDVPPGAVATMTGEHEGR